MTAQRDPDRLIRAFLSEGQTELADPVYDAVRAGVERRRQRAVIGPWRMPFIMNKLVPIGLGAAAVVVALIFGTQVLGPSAPNGVGGAPSAAPSATATPSVRPSSSAMPKGLVEGPFVLLDGAQHDGTPGVPISITIPAPGWYGERDGGVLVKNEISDPPTGSGLIVFAEGDGWYVPGDPCQWVATMPATRSTTVDGLVAALAAQTSRDASPPVPITVGGYAGKSITLHVPEDAKFADCDSGRFCTLADPVIGPSDQCFRYSQGPGQIDTLWIVDVKGQIVVIDRGDYRGTPASDAAELQAIVDSIKFE